MCSLRIALVIAVQLAIWSTAAHARINTVIIHNSSENSAPEFKLKVVSPASSKDAATNATFAVIDGRRDGNGGELEKLHDGKVPTQADQPSENFFFAAGTPGGRIVVDLGRPTAIDQINTYSWHPSIRGPQVFQLYGSDGKSEGFIHDPKQGTAPDKSGWKLVTGVDTRPTDNEGVIGGQYAVSLFDSNGSIGTYRYLLFDIFPTDSQDPFGNTFYSEIDIVSNGAPEAERSATMEPWMFTIDKDGKTYQITIDTSESPDLAEWAQQELAPVVKEWYPKIVAQLPSEDYNAPESLKIEISPRVRGVAATRGTRVQCSAEWFRRNLRGEAKGAVVHELVHVVQQYGRARTKNSDATRPPGWLTEGIADYIRWFLYEPESRGAEITQANLSQARYDMSYRGSANFLNWVAERYDRQIVTKLNAALRDGRYRDDLWSEISGRTLAELGDEWKASLERKLANKSDSNSTGSESDAASPADSQLNSLSPEEKAAGWVLLFDGRGLDGWHSFGRSGVRPGWRVVDGMLTCADPSDAGDLTTKEQFDWFDLRLEYKISEGGNSGIMFHVTDEERFAWGTGPEFQLEDNAKARDPIRCGWLYGLYQPPIDPAHKRYPGCDEARRRVESNSLARFSAEVRA